MNCKIDGCGREARYKAAQLCQKHYFRQWRNGTTDIIRPPAKPRQENPKGYQWVYQPKHPLGHRRSGYVAEHRAVLYADLGDGPLSCEICGVSLSWKECHVDHIDCNVRNNERSNLRPTCRVCNTRRGRKPEVEYSAHKIEFDGVCKTPAEWARDPRVSVAGLTIINRLKAGMSHADALFAPKVTHNGKKPQPAPQKFKHQRKNAIRIELDGRVMTAAEWAREPGCAVSQAGLAYRIKAGWGARDAVFQPARITKARAT